MAGSYFHKTGVFILRTAGKKMVELPDIGGGGKHVL
jgi:hypothetical protein